MAIKQSEFPPSPLLAALLSSQGHQRIIKSWKRFSFINTSQITHIKLCKFTNTCAKYFSMLFVKPCNEINSIFPKELLYLKLYLLKLLQQYPVEQSKNSRDKHFLKLYFKGNLFRKILALYKYRFTFTLKFEFGDVNSLTIAKNTNRKQ